MSQAREIKQVGLPPRSSTDPRAGWTSASNADADALCPGRYQAQKGMAETTSGMAKFGTEIHAAFEGQEIDLSVTQERLLEMANDIEHDVLGRTFAGQTGTLQVFKEKRYWGTFDGLQHSAQIDKLFILGNVVLIEDLKSLRGEVKESPENLQLRDQAALFWLERNSTGNKLPEKICVFINQPLVERNPTITAYRAEHLERAISDITFRLKRSHDPKAKRIPGVVQCKFCRARGVCREAITWAKQSPLRAAPSVAVAVGRLTPAELAALWGKRKTVESIMDAVAERLMGLGEEKLAAVGLRIRPGYKREKIVKPNELFARMAKHGVTVKEFTDLAFIPKGKVEELLRAKTKLTGSKLDTAMDSLLWKLTETKQTAPMLEKIE